MSAHGPNDRLVQRIEDALAGDVLLDESQLFVEVTDDVVTLAGTVESYAEKILAQHAVLGIAGVQDLVNAVDVKPAPDRHPSDQDLADMVARVLAWDALVPEQHIEISVVDGMVALVGSCATRAQAGEAERAVARLYGVRGVVNRIEVTSAGPSPTEIRTIMEEALRRRAAHQASSLDVAVDGPVVTVRGAVGSAMERRAVIGAVGHAAGVDEVRDELDISDGCAAPDS